MSTKTKTIKNIPIDVLHAFDNYKATLPDGFNDAQAFSELMKLTALKHADTKALDDEITALKTEVNELKVDLSVANQKAAEYETLKNNATVVGEENTKLQEHIYSLNEKITELEGQIEPPAPELTPDQHLMEVITDEKTIAMMRKVRPFYRKDNGGLSDDDWAAHMVNKAIPRYIKDKYEDLF